MKGLIIKDFFCLKKQLINYVFVIAGVIVVSVLFVLSCRFGNIHTSFVNMVSSGQASEADNAQLAGLALLLFMLVPLACTGDISNLFEDDEKASFYKVASSLPVSISKRVASRYSAGLFFIVIGFAVDLVMTTVLSALTDVISFGEFMGVIVSFTSLMIMYLSILILCMSLLGKGYRSYANIIPVVVGVGLYIVTHLDKLGDIRDLSKLYYQTVDFIEHKSYILLFAAMLLLISSYAATVYLSKRKRGAY